MKTLASTRPSTGLLGRPLLGLRSLLAPIALSVCLVSMPALAESADASPLSPSNFGVSALCAQPAPGYSGCQGLRLVPDEPLSVGDARALPQAANPSSGSSAEPEAEAPPHVESSTDSEAPAEAAPHPETVEYTEPIKNSLTPANLLSAYSLTGVTPPSTQTIALVDAYDDATIASDLEVFDSRFGLPACNEANACFRKVDQLGKASPLPASSGEKERGWAQEIATDVEIAHGICQGCRILLVEAKSNSNSDLYASEQTAASLGATEISNSFGGQEPNTDNAAFNHPGIVITASSGDDGYLNWFSEEPSQSANYPASSPHVVAVGGTRLILSAAKTWESESVWNDGGVREGAMQGAGVDGGGCSTHFTAPAWQQSATDWSSVGCGTDRSVADVAADADPYTGVAVYDSTETPEGEKGWGVIGGTSVASPIVAAAFALAGGAQGIAYPAQVLYENEAQAPSALHDVVSGSNGECLRRFHVQVGTSGCTTEEEAQTCSAQLRCLAAAGYDGPSGVGTPNGVAPFQPPAPGGSGNTSVPGVSEASPPPAAATGTSSPGTTAAAAPSALAPTPVVSSLSLTRGAIAALDRKRPKVSTVGFEFTLNTAARVRVTIARRVRVRGRLQWRTVSAAITLSAHGGAQARRLSGHTALAAGHYRLTVTPARGSTTSISFQIA
jgi:subtilase family protein